MIARAYLRLATLLVSSAVLVMAGGAYADPATIKIGAPLPLTGPLSPEGTKLKQGYDLWADTANAAGGISVGDVLARELDTDLVAPLFTRDATRPLAPRTTEVYR